jgi:hypothetical protein
MNHFCDQKINVICNILYHFKSIDHHRSQTLVMVDFGTLSPVTPEMVEGTNWLGKRGFLVY